MVWFGVAGEVGKLAMLRIAVERVMAGLGFPRDDRLYTPHVTLGRIRRIRARDMWSKGLAEVKYSVLPGFDVPAVSLFSSELRPTGAVYRELGRVALKEAQEPATA